MVAAGLIREESGIEQGLYPRHLLFGLTNRHLAKFGQQSAGNGIRRCVRGRRCSFPTARKPRGEPEPELPAFDKSPSTPCSRQTATTRRQSLIDSQTTHGSVSPFSRPKTTNFRHHVRAADRSQGYVSQKSHLCFPSNLPTSCLLSITPNNMRPLVQLAVRASRSARPLRAFKPTPNRFFHSSPRSLCQNSENDDEYRIIAHMTLAYQRAPMLTISLNRRLRPHPRRAR